ncbi:ComF family protein [Paucilactobacillus kaifaensis]|uniref:ComF family protein n=1 Tax=Paucilactobacillus kaifaensis TaxID=2559921 RepID=UPI001CC650E5|nr:phosphoribosyltransferase family protein [Paucilactobacillus kaifaensis]
MLHNRSLLAYNEATKQFMQQYKFAGDFRLRQVFSDELRHLINDLHADLIIPIPVNEYTWKTRGFNQVVGMLNNINYENLLISKNNNQHKLQSHKKRYERLFTKQPFKLGDQSLKKIKDKKIILVDDVYTTGRTLYHAADLVQSCQPSELMSVTLAR